jgi:HEAT repeat protein
MAFFHNKKTKLVAVILLTVLLSNTVLAKPLCSLAEDVKEGINEKFIKNLAMGIESENTGVKVSCIYFAGFYGFEELVGSLVKQLKKEADADVRILIALSLYKIGDKEGIKAVEELVKSDYDLKVKRMAFSILNQLKIASPERNSITSAQE